MDINPSDPIWGIKHLAHALGDITVDTAREYTYRHDFPAPKAPFKANLWLREEILAWFGQLPVRTAASTGEATRRSTTQHATRRAREAQAFAEATGLPGANISARENGPTTARPATTPSYRPRRTKAVSR